MTVQAIIDDTSNIRKRNNLTINDHAQLIRLCMTKPFVLDEVIKKTAGLFDSVESAQAAIKQIRVVMARGTTNLIEEQRLFPTNTELTEEEMLARERQRILEAAYIKARQEEMGAAYLPKGGPDERNLYKCPKCDLQGFIYKYRNSHDGVCFRCKGTGLVLRPPYLRT